MRGCHPPTLSPRIAPPLEHVVQACWLGLRAVQGSHCSPGSRGRTGEQPSLHNPSSSAQICAQQVSTPDSGSAPRGWTDHPHPSSLPEAPLTQTGRRGLRPKLGSTPDLLGAGGQCSDPKTVGCPPWLSTQGGRRHRAMPESCAFPGNRCMGCVIARPCPSVTPLARTAVTTSPLTAKCLLAELLP